MPIHLRENQYKCINAHLHSFLQNEPGGWKVFHSKHISDLAEALDRELPLGYEVGLTKSLQIVEYHPETGERLRRPEPDVTIYDIALSPEYRHSGTGYAPTLVLPVIETLETDEVYLTAIVIRRADDSSGTPAMRIELLSPTNKPPGDGYLQYREKRNLTIHDGVPLIEIDYLHETRSPIRRVPSYPDRQADSHLYYIAVTDPRALRRV